MWKSKRMEEEPPTETYNEPQEDPSETPPEATPPEPITEPTQPPPDTTPDMPPPKRLRRQQPNGRKKIVDSASPDISLPPIDHSFWPSLLATQRQMEASARRERYGNFTIA